MTWLQFLLSGVCHQWPEHALHFQGFPLPLCARCTGTFVAVFVALLGQYVLGRRGCMHMPSPGVRWVLVALGLFWLVDGANSVAYGLWGRALYLPNNLLRLLSGIGFGTGLAAVFFPILQYALRGEREEPALPGVRDLALLLTASALACLALALGGSLPWAPVAWAVGLICLGQFTLVNATLVALVAQEPRETRHPRRWAFYGVAGLLLTVLETGGMGLLRIWLQA